MPSPLSLYFERTMPSGYVRVYAIDEPPPALFTAKPALVILLGRRGHALRRREETFETHAARVRRVRALVTIRLRHGYAAVAGDAALFDMRRKERA